MELLVSISRKSRSMLYHATSQDNALKILTSKQFLLTAGKHSTDEAEFASGKDYFLSLTRSRRGGYHASYANFVMFTLDGELLSDRYKIKPVDYFKRRTDKNTNNQEYEERLLSNSPKLPLFKYLKRVDLCVNLNATSPTAARNALHIIAVLKRQNIPFSVFETSADWTADKPYDLPAAEIISRLKTHRSGGTIFSIFTPDRSRIAVPKQYARLKTILEAISTPDYEKMSEDAQNFCKRMEKAYDIDQTITTIDRGAKPKSPTHSLVVKIYSALKRLNYGSMYEALMAQYNKFKLFDMQKDINAVNDISMKLNTILTKPKERWDVKFLADMFDGDTDVESIAREIDFKLFHKCKIILSHKFDIPKSATDLLVAHSINPYDISSASNLRLAMPLAKALADRMES